MLKGSSVQFSPSVVSRTALFIIHFFIPKMAIQLLPPSTRNTHLLTSKTFHMDKPKILVKNSLKASQERKAWLLLYNYQQTLVDCKLYRLKKRQITVIYNLTATSYYYPFLSHSSKHINMQVRMTGNIVALV